MSEVDNIEMRQNGYEFLLNHIYTSKGVADVAMSATIYQKMQHEYDVLKQYASSADQDHLVCPVKRSFLMVRTYVQQAIQDGIKAFGNSMKESDLAMLNQIIALLNRNIADKRCLDHIIMSANNIFNQYKQA